MVTKEMLKNALTQLGVEKGMVLEVHSSLSSFGELEGGAETVINTLKEIVTELCGNASAEWYDCVNGEKTDKDYHSAIWIPVKKKD